MRWPRAWRPQLVLGTVSTVCDCLKSHCPALDPGSLPRAWKGVSSHRLLSLPVVPSTPFFLVFSFFLPPPRVVSLQEFQREFPLGLVVQLMGHLLPWCPALPACAGWSQVGVQGLYLRGVSRFHIFGWTRSLRSSASYPDALFLLLDDRFKGEMFKLENRYLIQPTQTTLGFSSPQCSVFCLWRPEPVMRYFKYRCSVANPLGWSYNSPSVSQLLRTRPWWLRR